MVDKRWVGCLGLIGLMLASVSGFAESLDAQRERYQQIKQAWDNNQMVTVMRLMPTLKDYPLYPYLEYRRLTQDMGALTTPTVQDFVSRYPTLPLTRTLTERYVSELARRQNWSALLMFSPQPPEAIAARCYYYYAHYAAGDLPAAWAGAKQIWLSDQSLPSACDALFSAWKAAGEQTPLTILSRIKLALQKNNSTLVNFLAKQLPANYRTISTALMDLNAEPVSLQQFARRVGPTDFTRDVTEVMFARLAKKAADQAKSVLPTIVRLQKIGNAQRQRMEEQIAWRLMGNSVSADEVRWRDRVIEHSHTVELIERRIRLALGTGDKQAIRFWLAKLPAEAAQQDVWRYWQAIMLMEQGDSQQGITLLQALSRERGFYPMVAAQKLGIPYQLRIENAASVTAQLLQDPAIARVRELIYWNMGNQARSEWNSLVNSKPRAEQAALARFANEQNWAELSVQATIVAKLWDHLKERFPLTWLQVFQQATENKGISPSYAMAIARQESAWNPKAQSAVGARGLMQVMPKTADYTAQKYNLTRYVESSQLLHPQTNIEIGTHYLEYVYQSLERNRILSSAAYNAGPSRVNAWLDNTNGRVDAVAFIESIPFSETRSYVKNVLAYDVYYRHFMNQPAKILTEAEWQRHY